MLFHSTQKWPLESLGAKNLLLRNDAPNLLACYDGVPFYSPPPFSLLNEKEREEATPGYMKAKVNQFAPSSFSRFEETSTHHPPPRQILRQTCPIPPLTPQTHWAQWLENLTENPSQSFIALIRTFVQQAVLTRAINSKFMSTEHMLNTSFLS